jgi:peptidyl-prolyl cis-trans isomerase A (cyclophilin A)
VRFDEGNHLLKEMVFPKSREELSIQVRKDDAIGRIWAAQELLKFVQNEAVREILAESASEDSFWAVRRASLESRAGEVDPNLSGFLIDKCRDTNSKVRTAAVRALGNLKSRDIIPFLIDLFEKDTSYLVQSEILRSLGKCGDEHDLPFLRKAAGIPSHRNILLRSAEAAIRSIENPRVLIKTELGDITVEIFEPKAPITATNFLKYVDSGRYDGSVFHRTVTLDNQPNDKVRIEVIQGGMLPREKSFGPIPHESTEKTGIKHVNGAISMARSRPGSATSSFFFCINNQPELDFGGMRNPDGQGFAAFGQVIAGMDVVRRIHGRPAEGQSLNPSVKIISIERIGR